MTGYGEITERLRRSTVQVKSSSGGGSGVIWSADGLIATNAHVAHRGTHSIKLWDGRELPGTVVLKDPRRDLALVRIAAGGLAPAESGDAEVLRPGEVVLAVGNPLGFEGALTTGVVHAVGPIRGLGRTRWVQADVRLAPGNSGGPLADARGRVVGINTMIAGGMGLAVPVNSVKQLVENGASPSLGVTVRPMQVAVAGKNSLGLMLLELDNDGAAAHASLLPGDLLTGVNGRPFQTMDDLSDAIEHGQPVKVQFLRAGGSAVREVTVAFEEGRALAA